MGYRQSTTECRVHLYHLSLDPATQAQCDALRQEAGRCWTDLVQAHADSRLRGAWLSETDLKAQTSGGHYALHSASVQALVEQLIANIDTTRVLRQQQREANQPITAHYPYHYKTYQTITWKASAIHSSGATLRLSNGRHTPALVLPLHPRYRQAAIRQVELLWRADHYELALTIDTGCSQPATRPEGLVAGVDLGEINAAAVVTEEGRGLVVSGRKLRAAKRLRNKRHAALTAKLARCTKGSRRWKRLRRRKVQASAKLYRQQRDLLHKAARQIVTFAHAEGVRQLAIGDVRDIQDGVDKGRQSNQKISQWPHGQMQHYLEEKARRLGMTSGLINERETTRTCSACGYGHATAPRGRRMRCAGCGVLLHRDGNGAANIASRAVCGQLAQVQVRHLMWPRGHPPALERPRSSRRGVAQRTPASSGNAGVAHPPSG